MHEFSIAREIATIVCDAIPPQERSKIRSIQLDIGEMSGVVPDSLEFCFEAIATELALPRNTLRMRRIAFRCFCHACQREFTSEMGVVVCPVCGGIETDVRSGRELRIANIAIEASTIGSP